MGNSVDIEKAENIIMNNKHNVNKEKLINISSAIFEGLDNGNFNYLVNLI